MYIFILDLNNVKSVFKFSESGTMVAPQLS